MRIQLSKFALAASLGLALAFAFGCSSDDGGGVAPAIPNPDPPAGIATKANSTSSVSIGWSTVSGATGYYIYRSTSIVGPYEQIGTSTSTLYKDDGLSDGTTYYYKIAGYNGEGIGSQSSYIVATTLPVAPTGVTAIASSSNSITISWSAVKGATGYRIYRSITPSGTDELIGTSTTTTYASTGLTSGTTYYYNVAAYNNGGEGSKSNAVSATTLLVAPTNITAKANSSNSITVSWSPVTGATNYRIYRNTTSTDDYKQVGVSTTTSYTDASVAAVTTYYYKVTAYNDGGESSQSTIAYATTPCAEPNIPTGLTRSGNTLSWNAVSGADSYRIYFLYQGNWTLFASSTQTSYTNSNIDTYVTYNMSFAVTAVSGTCESSRSSSVE